MKSIRERLFDLKDESYRDFQANLIPTVKKDCIIGVRTPELKKLAKSLLKADCQGEIGNFLFSLPHKYFDENQLHAFLIASEKDFDSCINQVDSFLPFIDNWATCDQLSPVVFKKNHARLLPHINRWIASERAYTVRFAISLLMKHFLDADFDRDFLAQVAAVKSDEYYVKMMVAWYFATSLSKQGESAILFFEQKRLPAWTHNKAIQKALESRRILPEQKEYLRTLKRREK